MSKRHDKMESSKILETSLKIIETASKKNIVLRLMGAAAIRIHSPKYGSLYEVLERDLSDIDCVSLGCFRDAIKQHLKMLNYVPRWFDEMPSIEEMRRMKSRVLVLERASLYRQIYDNPENGITIDVFFDKLEMCHTIDFRNRLTIDYPTIPLAEILLSKMQIVKLTEKDVKDVIVLLLEHEVGDTDNDTINSKYISKVLSKDWGFYYTFTTNLKRIRDELITLYSDKLKEENVSEVKTKINKILVNVEAAPKSIGWKLRSTIGTKKIWYREVE